MCNLHPDTAFLLTSEPTIVTMDTPQHLSMINDYYNTSNRDDAGFMPFPQLPIELRLEIWRLSIVKQRLIEIQLYYHDAHSGDSEEYKYIAVVGNGVQLHSKLLRVNREAREAALEFYRIHIPCVLLTGDNLARHHRSGDIEFLDDPQTHLRPLYLNPEHDILHIKAPQPAEHTFIAFIHDLKTYDPRGIGLVRLALGTNTISALFEASNNTTLTQASASPFSNLRNLIFTMHGHVGRAIIGHLIDHPAAGVRFNHSLPVKALAPAFDLAPDPRSKDQLGVDLRYICAFGDLCRMREQMQHVLQAWGIHQKPRERVLFAYDLYSFEPPIVDAKTAAAFLREEHENWLRVQVQRRFWVERAGKTIPVETEEELERVARPAVGFWLFDADAVGPPEEGDMFQIKRTLDLRTHWPELALSRLV